MISRVLSYQPRKNLQYSRCRLSQRKYPDRIFLFYSPRKKSFLSCLSNDCKPQTRQSFTCISSMLWTINMSCRSSIAPSIQLLKGAALLANSRWSWSIVSSNFSVLCIGWERYIPLLLGPRPNSTHTHTHSQSHVSSFQKQLVISLTDFTTYLKVIELITLKILSYQTLKRDVCLSRVTLDDLFFPTTTILSILLLDSICILIKIC